MSSITLLLLLCLSVHACNARSLSKQGRYLFNKEEESKAFLKEEAASKSATSGDHIIVHSLNDLQWLANNEVLQSSQEKARFLLGSSQDDTDEAVDSKENEFAEDTVVMDYAQPHRKPPIHNEKTLDGYIH